jgi:hypothetical protein
MAYLSELIKKAKLLKNMKKNLSRIRSQRIKLC